MTPQHPPGIRRSFNVPDITGFSALAAGSIAGWPAVPGTALACDHSDVVTPVLPAGYKGSRSALSNAFIIVLLSSAALSSGLVGLIMAHAPVSEEAVNFCWSALLMTG